MRVNRILLLLVGLTAASTFAAGGAARAEEAPRLSTLSLSAEGVVSAPPDTAVVTTGVVTEGETAEAALAGNNKSMAALMAALKDAGLPERDIQTSNFSLQPIYAPYDKPSDAPSQGPRITGYQVMNRVTVTISNLETAGPLLDKVVKVGANNIEGISFEVADDSALMDEARQKALKEAKRRADLYAEVGGFSVGRILDMSENMVSPPRPYAMKTMAMRAEMDSVPLAAGETDLRVDVQVTFEILPK